MALQSGRPLARSQATTVSPWLASATASAPASRAEGEEVGDIAQQLARVVLDPARRGQDLAVAAGAEQAVAAVVLDEEGLGRGRALVDRDDAHAVSLPRSRR